MAMRDEALPPGLRHSPGDDFVQALARGLEVVTAFDGQHAAMTLSEVARRTDLSRATARRLLLTLVQLGYVRTDGRAFTLAPKILSLGAAYLAGAGLPQVAQPHLERLSALVDESTSVAVLDGTDIVYVARVATRRLMTVAITVGTRFPAYATSMGRVLLAGLPPAELDAVLARIDFQPLTPFTVLDAAALRARLDETRASGWALVDQELELGLRSIAAPVRAPDGTVPAAVNVSMRAGSEAHEENVIGPLQQTAADVARDLAHLHQ